MGIDLQRLDFIRHKKNNIRKPSYYGTTRFLVGICRYNQGRRIRGFEGARAPPEHASAPSHCQKHPLKMKENVMKHCFKLTTNKVMVVLTLILGLYLGKTDAIYRFTLN